MSKFDEILNSSDASDALLGEQIDKITDKVNLNAEVVVLTDLIKSKITQITGGQILFTKAYGVKIITFSNVVISGSTMSVSPIDAITDITGVPINNSDMLGTISDSTNGKIGHIFVGWSGKFGVRANSAGTYNGQVVFF